MSNKESSRKVFVVSPCFAGSDELSVHRGMMVLMADRDCQGRKESRYVHMHLFLCEA